VARSAYDVITSVCLSASKWTPSSPGMTSRDQRRLAHPSGRRARCSNRRRMKGTFTRTYGMKVPFMRSGMEQVFPTCRVGGYWLAIISAGDVRSPDLISANRRAESGRSQRPTAPADRVCAPCRR
jgi:hypothetical protein